MSALTDRIYHLLRQGRTQFEIADIVGLSVDDVVARLRDPSLADPTTGLGIPGGGGGGGGGAAVKMALVRSNLTPVMAHVAWDPSMVVYDQIGLTIDPGNAFGENYICLPKGKYLVSAGCTGFTSAPSEFKTFAAAVSVAFMPDGMNPDYPSTFESTTNANEFTANAASSGEFGSLNINGVPMSCDNDLVALDPSLAGVFGAVKIFAQNVQQLDGGATDGDLDGHTLDGWYIQVTQIG